MVLEADGRIAVKDMRWGFLCRRPCRARGYVTKPISVASASRGPDAAPS